MKKILLLICLLFLTGCQVEYNVVIKDDSVHENLNFSIPNDYNNSELEDAIYNPSVPIINLDDYSNYGAYSVSIDEDFNQRNVSFDYDYDISDFSSSTLLEGCFESATFDYSKNNIKFNASGEFYCLYDNSSVVVNITTDNKVKSHNADDVNGNTYSWYISDNAPVSIKIEILKDTVANKFLSYLKKGVLLLLLVALAIFVVRLRKKNNEV